MTMSMNDGAPEIPHHARPAADAFAARGVMDKGLSQGEAAARLGKHGPNRLPEPPRRSAILRFLSHFHNILIYVLLGAAAITAGLGHLVDTGVILAVIIANALIGYVQEGRAEQTMDAIRRMLAPRTSVLRDGRRHGLDSAAVVPGDIVLLEAGEKVPADLRLTETNGLRIGEAILTGESAPPDKGTQAVSADAALGDRSCIAFSGTLVASGAGRGVVVATGPATEIGRISGMLATVETLTTPLVRQMDGFARWLTILILLIAAALLVYGYFVGHMPFPELFMTVVGLSVAARPISDAMTGCGEAHAMRHDPAGAAIVIMQRSLKMPGMAQAVHDLMEQGAPAFDTATRALLLDRRTGECAGTGKGPGKGWKDRRGAGED